MHRPTFLILAQLQLRRDGWRLLRGMRTEDARTLRTLLRMVPPARIEAAEAALDGMVRVWFDRGDARLPAAATAVPWCLPTAMLREVTP